MSNNYCPNCGHRAYQHARGKCQHIETVGHIVKVTTEGWTLKHPLAERENDKLFECTIHQQLSNMAHKSRRYGLELGEYAVHETDDGDWVFLPPEAACRQCDCGDIDSAVDIARAAMDGDGPPGMYDDYDQACLWTGLVRQLVEEIEMLRNAR